MEPYDPEPGYEPWAVADAPRHFAWGAFVAGLMIAGLAAVMIAALLIPGLVRLPFDLPAGFPLPGTAATPKPSATPLPSASVEPSFQRPTPSPAPTFTSYTVRVGDSLTSIALTFSTSPRSIAWWNRGTYPSLDPQSELYAPDRIEPGWTLVLIPGTTVDESRPPSPSPGVPTPSPAPSSRPTAAPTVSPSGPIGGPATLVTSGPRGTNRVALTLDMGGRLDPAVDIVTWLIDNKVHATLFPTGKSGTATPEGLAALRLAAAHPELFDFGNHSWDHPDFTGLGAAQMAQQLTSSESAIQSALGVTTKPWFRPPYGAWNDSVRAAVGAAGWSSLVMWDVDTIDWKPTSDGGPTASDITTRVLAKAQGGSIVLMHLGGWHTLEALPEVVAGLRAKGLVPVMLKEMLG